MPRRWCQDCGQLFDKADTGTQRCGTCQPKADEAKNAASRQYDRERRKPRGTAAQRGYGGDYQRRRKQLLGVAACHWCGAEFTPANPVTIDHVIPLARGGTNDPANLVAACATCNSSRGGKLRSRG